MKKAYEKPAIVFESFSLSTNIASGCANTSVTMSYQELGCGYQPDRSKRVIFTTEWACTTTEDDGDYNGICYHTPVDGSSLFTS